MCFVIISCSDSRQVDLEKNKTVDEIIFDKQYKDSTNLVDRRQIKLLAYKLKNNTLVFDSYFFAWLYTPTTNGHRILSKKSGNANWLIIPQYTQSSNSFVRAKFEYRTIGTHSDSLNYYKISIIYQLNKNSHSIKLNVIENQENIDIKLDSMPITQWFTGEETYKLEISIK